MPSFEAGDGRTLYYRDTDPLAGAERHSVVLLHGWACHGGYFDRQVDGLSDRRRLIIPDLRGHRHSHRASDRPTLEVLAADLQALLDHLRLRHPVLLGWSMGALVGFEFIRRYTDDALAGLIVVDMTPRVVNGAGWDLGLLGGFGAAQAERAFDLIGQDWPGWVDAFLPSVFAGSRSPDADLAQWMATEMRASDPAAMAALWQAMTNADHRAVLPTVAVPTLVVRGAESQLYGPATADRLAGSIPNATLATVPQAGHAPHLEQPEHTNGLFAGFVDGLE
ncbi:alpha/beta hydrolase [Thalassobaculum sp.]|uniref:alpha/beta fold hydrolase n=1 Tax=Thalassobaculum sp. TaxID=2022740 RepID=UPI0032EB48F5